MKHLIGKRVLVFWTDKARKKGDEWPSFRVLDADEFELWCQGVDSPDGSKHVGNKATICVSDTHDIIEWREGA